MKLKVRGVVFISSSSDSSVKISQLKQFSNWLSVRLDLLLTLIKFWLSLDIDLSFLLFETYSYFQSPVINFDYCFYIN